MIKIKKYDLIIIGPLQHSFEIFTEIIKEGPKAVLIENLYVVLHYLI